MQLRLRVSFAEVGSLMGRHCDMQVHVERQQMSCHLTRTTAATHALIEANLKETPVYGGWVDSAGPRYCPSIEDKIVRFRDKDSHQVAPLPLIYFAAHPLKNLGAASMGLRLEIGKGRLLQQGMTAAATHRCLLRLRPHVASICDYTCLCRYS